MAKRVVDESSLVQIGDAIRAKTGGTAALVFPAGMAEAISGITTGLDKTETELAVEITENGTYTQAAPEGKVYNKVTATVNVPGKEEQTKSVSITENGTITVTPDEGKVLSSVEITTNISGGGIEDLPDARGESF